MELRCTTCGVKVETGKNWTKFQCPSCGKDTIIRCERCKSMGNKYECSKCGFIGP